MEKLSRSTEEKQENLTETKEPTLFESLLYMTEGSYVVAKKLERLAVNNLTAKLTFYKGKSENSTKGTSGLYLRHRLTVAVDPRVIPLGTVLEIVATNGEKLVAVAADVCARAKTVKGKVIDIFIGKHEKIPREGVWHTSNITPIGFIPKEKIEELKQNPDALKETIDTFLS